MTQAYTDWLKRPEDERNAEAATVVMGWELSHDGSTWCADGECLRGIEDWSPCTDRNATDMLLAEVGCKVDTLHRFIKALLSVSDEERSPVRDADTDVERYFEFLRASPSLLTWAAIEACRGGEA